MTSSNGNIFRVTGPFHRWIPRTKASDAENINAPRHWPLWGNSLVTGEFPAQRASNAEMFPFDDVIMMLPIDISHVRNPPFCIHGEFVIEQLSFCYNWLLTRCWLTGKYRGYYEYFNMVNPFIIK